MKNPKMMRTRMPELMLQDFDEIVECSGMDRSEYIRMMIRKKIIEFKKIK